MNNKQVLTLIDYLVEKTNQNKCLWEYGNNEYRLVLKSGVIVFKYSYMYDSSLDQFSFSLSLYNTVEKFASYYSDAEENYDEDLYKAMDVLRMSIQQWKERIIDGKMNLLIDEIKQF